MYDLLNERIKNKAVTARTLLTRKDKEKIMRKAYKLTKQKGADFTKEDMKDLRKIVDRLRKSSEEGVLPTKGSDNVNTSQNNNYQPVNTDKVNKFSGSNIKLPTNLFTRKFNSTKIPSDDVIFNNEHNDVGAKGNITDDSSDDLPDPAKAKDLSI